MRKVIKKGDKEKAKPPDRIFVCDVCGEEWETDRYTIFGQSRCATCGNEVLAIGIIAQIKKEEERKKQNIFYKIFKSWKT